jgi:hypothetical protein
MKPLQAESFTGKTEMIIFSESIDRFGIPLVAEDYKTAKVSFEKQKADSEEIRIYLDDFKKLKDQKVKDPKEKNIDLWAKGSFEHFKKFVDSLKEKTTKSQEKKLVKTEGATLVSENDKWRVYKITSHKACRVYGSNTKWCITEPGGDHWNSYSSKNNFYFIISKVERDDPWNKIAVQVDFDGKAIYYDEHDSGHKSLPSSLGIPKFKMEPKRLEIKIDGKNMSIKEFQSSKGLEVKGTLDLSGTPITSLPDNLSVGGSLYLADTSITSLPDRLSVGGNLDLSGTKITSLSDNLSVGGNLYLANTKITSLPDRLSVGGYLYLRGTPLSKKWKDSMKPKGVKGGVLL